MTQAVVRAIALPLEAASNAGSDASETSQTPEEPPTTCEPLIAFTLAARMRAHAMLHQLNRDRDEHGQVVASLDDYEVMRGIGGGVLSEGVAATVPDVVRQTVEAVNELDKPNAAGEYEGVQASAIADHLKLDKSAARRRLLRAGGGYVQNLETRRGRAGRWRVAEDLPEDVELLPSPHRLATAEAQENVGTEQGGGTVASGRERDKRSRAEPSLNTVRGVDGGEGESAPCGHPREVSNTDNGRCRGDETADPTATLATCLICGLPLDPVMAATGGTTHPSCDPRRLLALRNEETR